MMIFCVQIKDFELEKCLKILFSCILWNVFYVWVHILWTSMDYYGFYHGSSCSVTESVEQVHNSWETCWCFMWWCKYLGNLSIALWLRKKGTNNLICLYTNRKGFQCIWSLFMMQKTIPGSRFWLCKNLWLGYAKLLVFGETWKGKEGIKKTFWLFQKVDFWELCMI